ncbi:MAG: carbon-nitrogen hydrolase family protein [Deltaproteobacteria bacterium]|nr:carbon-nitrogen hydrolase family protein [Deltaproteobacteria bacterium]
MNVAVVQICSGEDAWANLAQVQAFVLKATDQGADLVCFPENILFRGRKSKLQSEFVLELDAAGKIAEISEFSKAVVSAAREWKISVSLGSVLEKNLAAQRPFNSQWILHPQKPIVSYKKIHLFHFDSSTAPYRESDSVSAGTEIVSSSLKDFNLGLSICFDLRFPELYRRLVLEKNANLLLVPSAFTRETGEAHWHTLLRARAIENQSYVVAAAQWGSHLNEKGDSLFCYGHALACDPWGKVLAEGAVEGDELLMVEVSLKEIERRRAQLPALNATKLKC